MLINALELTCQEYVFYETNPQLCACLLLLLVQPVTAPNIQQVASALKDKTVTTSTSFRQTFKKELSALLTDKGFPMGPIALAIGNSSVEWALFALTYPFHEKDFMNALYDALKDKFKLNFQRYINADFIAWVMLFEAPASVVRPCIIFDRLLTP